MRHFDLEKVPKGEGQWGGGRAVVGPRSGSGYGCPLVQGRFISRDSRLTVFAARRRLCRLLPRAIPCPQPSSKARRSQDTRRSGAHNELHAIWWPEFYFRAFSGAFSRFGRGRGLRIQPGGVFLW